MSRVFVVDGREMPDPDPTLTVEQVRASYAAFFPELATAEVKTSKKEDGTEVVEFQKRAGVKG